MDKNTNTQGKKKLKTWQIVLIVIGIVVIIGVIGNIVKPQDTETTTANVRVSADEYTDIDYLVLYDNYKKYTDKYVKICGQISAIDKNITNTVYITFKDGISGLTGEIYCNIMDSKANETLSKYKKGDYVEIAGRVGNMTLKTLNLNDCYVVSDGDGVKNKIDNYNKAESSTTESSKVTSDVTNEPTENRNDFIKSCSKTYTYKDIARNPNTYIGKRAMFEGEVIQVLESGNNVILRVNITKEENEFMDSGYLYTDTVYVEYTRKNDNESRILENDIITMYGTLNGTKSYDSVLQSSITVPYFIAEYIDINE